MKFKFPLQKVLEHRKLQENLKMKDFQEVQAQLLAAEEVLRKMLEQEHQAHERAGHLAQSGGNQGPALSQIHEFLNGQKLRVQRQRQQVEEIEKLVESKREILLQAARDYKIMEKMREKKFEEYRQERLSQEQKEANEQSILRFKVAKE